jgi:hypothetical protein
MKSYLFVIVSVLFISCGSIDLGLKAGRITVTESSKGGVYFYRIVNGLSTDAYFLSMKNDLCKGLNKNEDYCFMVLDPIIYYKIKMDTLFVYTSAPAVPPTKFGFGVEQKTIKVLEWEHYEKMYKENKIQKVIIDSLYSPDCKVSY